MDTTQPQVGEVNENLVDAQPQAEVATQPQAAEPNAQMPTDNAGTTPYLEVQVIEEVNGKRQKNDRKLTKEEAIQYAQKGFDYDRIREKLQAKESELERAKKAAKVFDEMASETGRSYDDVIAMTERQRLEAKAKKEGKTVGELEAIQRAERAEAKSTALETEQKARERHAQEKADFESEYPGVDVATLPEELLNEWLEQNVPLKTAYRTFKYDEAQAAIAAKDAELKALQERMKEMEQKETAAQINESNAEASLGKLGAGATAEQPLSDEAIEKMTPAEREKNHAKIWAYLTGNK